MGFYFEKSLQWEYIDAAFLNPTIVDTLQSKH